MTLLLVLYDLPDDRLRLRVARILKNYGTRVQNSVFECLLTPAQLKHLTGQLERLVAPGDPGSIRFYTLCKKCQGRIKIQGTGKRTVDPLFYFV